MDQRTFVKKVAVWTAAVAAIIIFLVGVCFGKMIEESLFAEVCKWIVMAAVVIGILEGFVYFLGPLAWHFFIERKDEDKD